MIYENILMFSGGSVIKTFIIILFCFLINLDANTRKNILILNSYHESMPWSTNIKEAIYGVLQSETQNNDFYIENMDTKKYNDNSYYKNLSVLYKNKYHNTDFDLILSSDNNALEFLKKYRNEIFGKVPVVFGGINNYNPSMLEGHEKYTGVAESISYEKNIQLILKLNPAVKNIFFVNDYLKTGRIFAQEMQDISRKYKDKVRIIYNENSSFSDLKIKISQLEKNTVILLGAYYSDKNNQYIEYADMAKELLEITALPVYSTTEFAITHNIIGGHVISSFSQGSIMAKLGQEILQGRDADDLRVIEEEGNEYIFNGKALQLYNIGQNNLPQNSDILYNNITYYDQFENMFNVKYLLVIIFMIVITIFLYKKFIFNEKAILKLLVYGPVIFLPLVIGTLIYNLVQFNDKVYKNEIKKLKIEYLKEQKNIARDEIEKTTAYIRNLELKMTLELKENLKKRVDEAYVIAKNIYYENHKVKSDIEIQKMIIDALSKIRFFEGRGYFFINTNNGDGILFNGISRLKDKPNLINLKDSNGEYIMKNQIKIVQQDGEGLTSHLFRKINGTIPSPKLTYVKMFEPYNWHIGTGEHLEDFYQVIKKEILNYVTTTRYGNNGYLFALTPKGIVLAHGDSHKYVGKDMSKKQDTSGVFYAKEIIKNAMLNNYKFTEYGWFNKEMQKLDTKYAYASYSKKYNLIIGTGVYDNDVNKIIVRETLKLNKKNNEQIEEIIKISLIVLILVLMISFILSHVIKKIFQDYNQKLTDLNVSLEQRIKEEIVASKEKDNLLYQQSKMASMGEMIGNIAHQWRQPLSIISVGATGLKLQKEHNILTDKYLLETCDSINYNAQYLSKTIDDFKNYIKNDRDKVSFNLAQNIRSFLSLVDSSIKRNQIEVHLDLDENLTINSYPNELTQCFMNLFNNAKDALSEIKTQKHFFIQTKVKGSEVFISFKDNAGGINEDVIHNIFEPYFTTKHKSQGTGLGLSMTYKIIVEGMKGTITTQNSKFKYKDEKFHGAEFIIKLDL